MNSQSQDAVLECLGVASTSRFTSSFSMTEVQWS